MVCLMAENMHSTNNYFILRNAAGIINYQVFLLILIINYNPSSNATSSLSKLNNNNYKSRAVKRISFKQKKVTFSKPYNIMS